jgi:lysozyme
MASKVAKTARWLVVCASFVGGFEGLYCTAYPDRLARNIPTVCYGETEGVHLGDHYTPEQCRDLLANKLPRYWAEEVRCTPGVHYTDNERIAYTSFGYNLGTGTFCKGPGRFLRKGDHRAACENMLLYDHASGKKVRGLTRRRQAEYKLCMTPDKPVPLSPAPAPTPAPVAIHKHPWWDILYWFFGIE